MSPVDLKDYVDVKERIRLFYERHPDGRLVTAKVKPSTEPDGVPRIWVKAYAYRTVDDPLPGKGWSWIMLPGSTPYTRGSEIENAETSAWGRAIGSLGIGITASIATTDEIRSKERVEAKLDHGDDGSLIGIVEVGKVNTSDFLLRPEATRGHVITFRLRGDRGGILVRSFGPLARQLDEARELVVGKRVTVWGSVGDETLPASGNKPEITFAVMTAERIRVPGVGDLPVAEEPPIAPGQEPMFTEDEQAAIDAALGS